MTEIPTKKPVSIIKFALVAFVLIIICGMAFNQTPTSSNTESTVIGTPEEWVVIYAEKQIEKLLKAPATAKYCDPKVTDLGEGKYVVASCVDSENSFGANLRSNWTVTMTYSGSNIDNGASWTTNMVVFDDEVVYDSGE